jgi:arsenate reductase
MLLVPWRWDGVLCSAIQDFLSVESHPQGSHVMIHVLFLCMHNSARSLMAEAMLNHLGKGRFRAFSAGSQTQPDEQPHPLTLNVLSRVGFDVESLYSKSWDEFTTPEAPRMDLVITLCDDTAEAVCPVWPGHPATAHWGYPDPVLAQGDHAHQEAAFHDCIIALHHRLELLLSLPVDKLEPALLGASAQALAQRSPA